MDSRLSRREFVQLTAALAAGMAGLTVTGCTNTYYSPPVRRDVMSLAPDHPVIKSYEKAIVAMQNLPSTDARNWTKQALIHQNSCRHASWLFFPWHRAYLRQFEDICRGLSGDDSFALPYWDWTTHPEVPPIFWDTSTPLFHSPRSATPGSSASPQYVGQAVIAQMLNEPNFLLFAGPAVPKDSTAQFGPGYGLVEQTPHNYVHGFVGGTMGTFMSPLDPLFWLHHCNVDRLWAIWNLTRMHPNTSDDAWLLTTFNDFCDRNGSPVPISVLVTLFHPLFSYRYDNVVTP